MVARPQPTSEEARAALRRAGWRWVGLDPSGDQITDVFVLAHRACLITSTQDGGVRAQHVAFHRAPGADWQALPVPPPSAAAHEAAAEYWCRPVGDDDLGVWYYEVHTQISGHREQHDLDATAVRALSPTDLSSVILSIVATSERKIRARRTT